MTSQPVSAPTAAPASAAPAADNRTANDALPPGLAAPAPNGSPNRSPSRASRARGWTTRSKLLLAAAGLTVVALLGTTAVYALVASPFKGRRADLVTHRVEYGRLELTIVERGALE